MKVGKLKGRFLVDTNVLIYATLAQDPRHEPALEVLGRGRADGCEAFVSAQNLAEMYPNLTGPKTNPPDTPEVAGKRSPRSVAYIFSRWPVTYAVTVKALELCARYNVRRQGYFDMQLAATALLSEVPTIVTENVQDFTLVEGLSVVNPFEG